jgi:uncharacterized membrane protein YfcA
MDVPMLILLGSAVFGASCLQSATGIGYGVIAGPIFLVILNGIEAFQISTIHNFCIALILLPMFWGQINRKLLCWLVVGSFGGIPFGFYLQTTVDIVLLKIAASLMVGFVTVALILDIRKATPLSGITKKTPFENIGVGSLSGLMGGMLAMPGPLAATWMSIRGVSKSEVRATVLAFFLFAYGANIMLYTSVIGVSADVLSLSLWLLPPLVLGIVAGNGLSNWYSEQTFRYMLLLILILTMVLLVADWGRSL